MTREEAGRILAEAGIADAATDARRILDFAQSTGQDARPLIARRAKGAPVAHILGYRDFWKHRFKVTPDVLDPRPDTETLVEAALKYPFDRVLDLGTGSGCIVVSLLAERDGATGVGSDASDQALRIASENACAIGVDTRLTLIKSDWLQKVEGCFDLIVSNPPYIAKDEMSGLQPEVRDHEPRVALTDENDGLDAYRAIAAGACDHLTSGGRLLVEIGPTQAGAVSGLFEQTGLENITVYCDLDGRDRVVAAQKSA